MSRLFKGMYGSEFNRSGNNLFGIGCGQIRANDMVHNGGWYNAAGEKLGWGDLSPEDFLRIRNELQPDEMFIILGERDAFWNFVTANPGPIGSMAVTKPDAEAPGVDYVAKHAMYIIAPGQVYSCSRYGQEKEFVYQGVSFTRLTAEEARLLIARSATVA